MTPYRVIVATAAGAFVAWTPDQTADPARLQGSGALLFAGIVRAIAAARYHLRGADVRQVQIRTNQDRKVLVYNRRPDGTFTHYRADGEA